MPTRLSVVCFVRAGAYGMKVLVTEAGYAVMCHIANSRD
jgi:hypothetical protein